MSGIREMVVEFQVSGGIPSLDAFGGVKTGPGGFMFVSDATIKAWVRKYWEMLGLPLFRGWSTINELSVAQSSAKNLSKIQLKLEDGLGYVDSLFGFSVKLEKKDLHMSWVFGPVQVSYGVSKRPVKVHAVKVTSAFASKESASMRSFGLRYAVWGEWFLAYILFNANVWSAKIWKRFFENGAGRVLAERHLLSSKTPEGVWEFIKDSVRGAVSSRFSGMVKITGGRLEDRGYDGPVEMWKILGGEV